MHLVEFPDGIKFIDPPSNETLSELFKVVQ